MRTIQATIQIPKPTIVILRVYAPMRSNQNYIVRQLGTKESLVSGNYPVTIPIPFGGKKLKVRAYDVSNGKYLDVNITKVVDTRDKSQDTRIKTQDNLRSFIDFAQNFAIHSGAYGCGLYLSECGKHKVRIQRAIKLGGETLDTVAGTDHGTRVIDVVKNDWHNLTVFNRFFILLHEHCHYTQDTQDEFECDRFAYEICSQMGVSQTEILYSLFRVFDMIPEGSQKEQRIQAMHNYIMGGLL